MERRLRLRSRSFALMYCRQSRVSDERAHVSLACGSVATDREAVLPDAHAAPPRVYRIRVCGGALARAALRREARSDGGAVAPGRMQLKSSRGASGRARAFPATKIRLCGLLGRTRRHRHGRRGQSCLRRPGSRSRRSWRPSYRESRAIARRQALRDGCAPNHRGANLDVVLTGLTAGCARRWSPCGCQGA
jgi:hypothetical protein